MRLTSIRLRNFLTFGNDAVYVDELGDTNILVGPNGGGKTSLLRAIEYVGSALAGVAPWAGQFVHQQDPERRIELDVAAHLTEEEVRALVTTSQLSVQAQQFHRGGQPPIDINEADRAISTVIEAAPQLFVSVYSSELHFVATSAIGHSQETRAYVRTSSPREGLCLDRDGRVMREPYVVSPWGAESLQDQVYSRIVEGHPGAFQTGPTTKPVEPELLSNISRLLTPEWLYECLGPRDGHRVALHVSAFQPDQDRFRTAEGQPRAVIELLSFLSSRGNRQRFITPFEVLAAIYNSSIVRLSDDRSKSFSPSILTAGSGGSSAQRVTGFNLAKDLFELKVSPYAGDRIRFTELRRKFEELSGVSFDSVLSSRTVQPSTVGAQPTTERYEDIVFTENQISYPSDLAAAGFCELLLVLYSSFGPSRSILLLDEPALNLHPVKQRELHSAITSFAREAENQVLIVTHSPAFVETSDIEGMLRFQLKNGASLVTRLKGHTTEEQVAAMKLLGVAPALATALFSRRVVLVEGEGEEAALPVWFSKCNFGTDLASTGTIFLNVHGNLNFSRYSKVLDSWEIPYRMIGDGSSSGILSRFSGRGYWFEQTDFTALATHFCEEAYRSAREEWGGRDKDALVARMVALSTDPPPPIRSMFESLRPFFLGEVD